jgi:hypothetical protein
MKNFQKKAPQLPALYPVMIPEPHCLVIMTYIRVAIPLDFVPPRSRKKLHGTHRYPVVYVAESHPYASIPSS